MTILYLYQYFGTPKGGWSTRVYEMCRRWVKEGHTVIVITTPYDKSDIRARKFIETQYHEGIEVIVVNVLQSNKHSLIKRLLFFLLYSVLSIYFVLRLKYNVVVASSGPITIGFPGILAKVLRGKVLVFEVRDLWPRGAVELGILKSNVIKKICFWFEGLCYKASSLIVACSQGMADDIFARYPNKRVIVVPNACDVELFQRPGVTLPDNFIASKDIVIYAGSLGLMDNCLQIVEAANVMQQHNADIAIVVLGEGAERKMLEQKSKDLGLTNIYFLGLMSKEEVVRWMKAAKVSLVIFKNVPVLDTSSPNKFFDSLAAGLPIIQTTQGWIKDVVETYNLGITVNPNNANEMANAILKICNDALLQKRMAENSLKVAIEVFERHKLSMYMLKNIEDVAGNK